MPAPRVTGAGFQQDPGDHATALPGPAGQPRARQPKHEEDDRAGRKPLMRIRLSISHAHLDLIMNGGPAPTLKWVWPGCRVTAKQNGSPNIWKNEGESNSHGAGSS